MPCYSFSGNVPHSQCSPFETHDYRILHLLTRVCICIFYSQGAEFVVALTHMRGPNDRCFAEQATGIDLILGGHDHDYFSEKVCFRMFIDRALCLNQ